MSSSSSESKGVKFGDLCKQDGDVAIFLTEHGTAGVAILRDGDEFVRLPHTVKVSYDSRKDSRPQRVRHVEIRAGYTQKNWER